MDFKLARLDSLSSLEACTWNVLAAGDPFTRHEFLIALEHSGAIGEGTAWRPSYLTLTDANGTLVGALLLYVKFDSFGEFVFDWGWADAYERAGRRYYPKLVSAIPFTPATGPRLLVSPTATDGDTIRTRLVQAALELAEEIDASSLHVLFPTQPECTLLGNQGFLPRKGYQFHWHNRGYTDFEAFLSRFTSAKRKKVHRERRRIQEAGITFSHMAGNALDRDTWDAVFGFYTRTFLLHGHQPYLSRSFFNEISQTMPENIRVIIARDGHRAIAAAICFRSVDTLYGRYWGSDQEYDSLHFETCYYQGINYCIDEGLRCYEPGTQGEHKISRGFSPTPVWSSHWLAAPDFRAAVADFLQREHQHVDTYLAHLADHLPYRRAREER